MPERPPSIAVLYHFFAPDDVVSATLFSGLCSGLAARGWDVTAYPSVRSCHAGGPKYPSDEIWEGVRIKRVWRPPFRQASGVGRLANAVWMIARWAFLAVTLHPKPDILLIGTDPLLSLLVAPVWNALSRKTKIVHWCFDLYPEAAMADGLIARGGVVSRILERLLAPAYRCCALIADLGPCMRALLLRYDSRARRKTFVPWGLEEGDGPMPKAVAEREIVFGAAQLGLLYSGSFGRAHSFEDLLELAKRLDGQGGRIVFSVRGNRETELREAVKQGGGRVELIGFAAQEKLSARLACADVHVVSLRTEWTGSVVPSKFFGALGAGRPVLFLGSESSSIALWIREYKLGWVLGADNIDEVAQQLIEYGRSTEQRAQMQMRCFDIYTSLFSRTVQVDGWNLTLRSLLSE